MSRTAADRSKFATLQRPVACIALLAVATVLAASCTFSLGDSVERRPLLVQTFGSGPRTVLLIGGLHTGGEDNTRVMAEQVADYLRLYPQVIPPSVTVYVLPSANPDGSARRIHTNARGVDLNRNWPADNWSSDACHPSSGCRRGLGGPHPLSEPETAAIYNFALGVQPEVTLVWHSQAPLVEANEVQGADVYGRVFAGAAGYPYVEEWTSYRITGQLIDAFEQRLGLRAFDVELARCCEVTYDELTRNVNGVVALLRAVDAPAPPPRSTTTPAPTRTPTKTKTTTGIPRPTQTPRAPTGFD